jgi:tetratricopeptide (TPR) repeat protein
LRSINPAIPGTVEFVVRTALSFDPDARYPNAGKFAQALEGAMRAIAETPVEPYLGAAPIVVGTEEEAARSIAEDGDRTLLADEPDDRTMIAPVADDRTLVAPPEPPATRPREPGRMVPDEPTPLIDGTSVPDSPTFGAPPPSLAPPAIAGPTRIPRRPPEPERRGPGGTLVRVAAVVGLIAAGIWGWERTRGTDEAAIGPPAPDSAAEAMSDSLEDARLAAAEALALSERGVAAYTADPPRYVEALELFERAVILDPDDWHYRRNHGMTLSQLGDHDAAILQLETALELDPTQAVTWASLGSARLARGDRAGALAAFRESVARETNPDDRARAEGIVRELELAGQPTPPLLGEPIEADPAPTTNPIPVAPPSAPDSPSSTGPRFR